jgi:tetratricopeptide (TPR) repeat protein
MALERALTARPTPEGWERLGLVRHLQNKFAEAVPAFEQALRLKPSLWTSHLFLGICLYRINDFGRAQAALERADKLAGKTARGRDDIDYWLGAAYIANGKSLAGVRTLERLLDRNPSHADALELAVRTYAEASAAAWNEVGERYPETAAGYEVLAHALEGEGNRDGALAAFRKARELDAKRAGPGLAVGRLLLLNGKAKEALAVLEQELALPAAEPEAHYYAGIAAIQLGRHADAVRWLEHASQWVSRIPEAPLALAQVYLALKRPEKAAAAARQAVTAAPASAAAHELLQTALTAAGLHDELAAEEARWQRRAKP